MLHAMGPITAASCGIALVILAGKIDISIGSIAFLSASIGGLLMESGSVHPAIGFIVILGSAALLGAVNGFVIAYLGVNALITTLGTMIAFRGLGLVLTEARVIPLPEAARSLGNLAVGPVFVDTIVIGLVICLVHFLYRHTVFGRRLMAVGNNEETAVRIGIDARMVTFRVFVLSGLLAGVAASSSFIQVGSISGFLGRGLEFMAIAAAVVGGISLAGGRGTILPGVALGALSFQIIANGLNQVGANPYVYQLVTGVVIFVAMYMDALRSTQKSKIRVLRSIATTKNK
ncbi:ABC transporter permease [Mesorhizobium sp. AaZ16]|uniref:ABC transporter permease n=1 Tax=Mesorhizobium sp. AaZ16 TaxID=3402289 RepID=UPI00374EAF75